MEVVPFTWPVGMGKRFHGVMDLREQRMRVFAPGEDRQPRRRRDHRRHRQPGLRRALRRRVRAGASTTSSCVQRRRAAVRRGGLPRRPADADVLRLGDQQLRRARGARRAGRPGAAARRRAAMQRVVQPDEAQVQRRGLQDPGQHGPGAPRPHRLRARRLRPLRARHAPEGRALGKELRPNTVVRSCRSAASCSTRPTPATSSASPTTACCSSATRSPKARRCSSPACRSSRRRCSAGSRSPTRCETKQLKAGPDATGRGRRDPGLPPGRRRCCCSAPSAQLQFEVVAHRLRARVRRQGAHPAQPLPDRALGHRAEDAEGAAALHRRPTPTASPTTRSMRRRCWWSTRPSCAPSRPTGRRSGSTRCASTPGWCCGRWPRDNKFRWGLPASAWGVYDGGCSSSTRCSKSSCGRRASAQGATRPARSSAEHLAGRHRGLRAARAAHCQRRRARLPALGAARRHHARQRRARSLTDVLRVGERFASLPFDLGDASIAEAAARLKVRHVLSIDADFNVCRDRAGKPLVNLLR